MERRLGRGLGSLLGHDVGESKEKSDAKRQEATPGTVTREAREEGTGAREIPLHAISPNPYQPREIFDPQGLEELRDSIKVHGILQPIVLRKIDDRYEIVSGERRWRASRLAGKSSIPAIVRRDIDDQQMLELAIIENVQREDLNAVERARGYRRLVDELSLTQEAVAKRVGLKRSSIANHLRLLELPEPVLETLAHRLITMGHARALLGLPDPATQTRFAEEVVRGDLSVRETERRVREHGKDPEPTIDSEGDQPPPPWLVEMEARLSEHLGTRVRVKNSAEFSGQILVEYYTREDLERLYEHLAPKHQL